MKYGLGKYLHTFTVLGACKKTGQLGIGIATYSLGVGGYCPVLKSNLGVSGPPLDIIFSMLLNSVFAIIFLQSFYLFPISHIERDHDF